TTVNTLDNAVPASVLVDPGDDSIYVTGEGNPVHDYDSWVIKLTASGTPDGSFGTNGVLANRLGDPGVSADCQEVDCGIATNESLSWSEGNVLIAGRLQRGVSPKDQWVLERIDATTGAPDTSFGDGGSTIYQALSCTASATQNEALAAITVPSINRII